jgi:hypothetical protein
MKNILLLTLFLLSNSLFAQEKIIHKNHDNHKNEIGIANSPVYFINEKQFNYGLHLHYIYNISKSKFGIGLGYERIFDEHEHSTFGMIGVYKPIEKLSLSLSPGLTYENEVTEPNFALHTEATYEFEINDFHFGPVLEFAYDKEDFHISLGIHCGIGF